MSTEKNLQEIRMKVSREQAAQNRERIVETAAQLFRERGFEGIGVADLMKEAGLTHGGFYGHFSSKEDLIAEASSRALMRSLAVLSKVAERAAGDPLAAQCHRLRARRCRSARDAGCGQIEGRTKTEGHQHVRNIGRRHGHGARRR
jgi:TetR/AcrR family transcriptional regulator, transcriptional repressor for nem operon